MLKRGYFVNEVDECDGVGVIATSVKEAKKIAFYELTCEWIDMRCRWVKEADIKDLPIGITDDKLGLRCGVYGYLEDKCDVCGLGTVLEWINGQALCFECGEKLYAAQKELK